MKLSILIMIKITLWILFIYFINYILSTDFRVQYYQFSHKLIWEQNTGINNWLNEQNKIIDEALKNNKVTKSQEK